MFVKHAKSRRDGFTLIELLVAVAIIGVLVSILIPTFATVTRNAGIVATRATISVLERGLESYRSEDALGGAYPPSRSDDLTDPPIGVLRIANPLSPLGNEFIGVSGANLLVYGLAGADQLGTPGFPDLDGDGRWWNDQRSAPGGGQPPWLYELDSSTREPLHPRYPNTGGSYVDEPTSKTIKTLDVLKEDGVVADLPDNPIAVITEQPFFTDKWDRPILYYRANRGARKMITDPGNAVGVYDSRDNAILTGTNTNILNVDGVDFGPGRINDVINKFSKIGTSIFPGPIADPNNNGIHDILKLAQYDNTFERFILNPSVTQRNEPVNRDKYLLISTGPDGIYGSTDDVINWTRE